MCPSSTDGTRVMSDEELLEGTIKDHDGCLGVYGDNSDVVAVPVFDPEGESVEKFHVGD